MLKMARDEQQKLLLLDLLVLVMAAPVMILWTMGIEQYIYQDNTIRNPHMIESEEDQNTHCNDSKGKFAVTMNSVMGIRGLSHCLNGEQTVLVLENLECKEIV